MACSTYYTSKNASKNNQQSSQNRLKIVPKSVQNRSKITAKSTQIRCKNGLRHEVGFGVRFWTDFGPNLEPTWGLKSGHAGTMLAEKAIFEGSKRHHKIDMILNAF